MMPASTHCRASSSFCIFPTIILKATKQLVKQPDDLEARSIILYGASIATAERLGIGKEEENYSYDIYEVEFIPEALFGASYRKSLTTLFPRFLKAMATYHKNDIFAYLKDVFGYEGDIIESTNKMIALFSELGVEMYFDDKLDEDRIRQISIDTKLSMEERITIIKESIRVEESL